MQAVDKAQIYTISCDPAARRDYADPLIGKTLDAKYVIEEVLGWGGMSVVYRARQLLIDRPVAIKTIKFKISERPDIWRRFEREIKTLSKLSHPNVVTVYDCFLAEGGQPFVVMDYIPGGGLDALLLEERRLPLALVRTLGCQIAAGIEHAHRHGIVHRDVKPANIMLLEGQVKVVDFGLAKLGNDDPEQKLTQAGHLWGSPPYVSPEQIKGQTIDQRSDIYSLGAVIFEMVTGRDPFFGPSVHEILHHHLRDPLPAFAQICPDPAVVFDAPELEEVLARAMAKDPDERYQTMGAFRDALEEACLSAESRARVGRDEKYARLFGRFNPLVSAGILGLVFAVAAGAVAIFNRVENAGLPAYQNTRAALPSPVKSIVPQAPAVFKARVGDLPSYPVNFHHLAHPNIQNHRQRHISSLPAGHRSTISPLVKKTLPKPSQLTVDQSKFEVLRDLKSPSLRRDCGDLPQR